MQKDGFWWRGRDAGALCSYGYDSSCYRMLVEVGRIASFQLPVSLPFTVRELVGRLQWVAIGSRLYLDISVSPRCLPKWVLVVTLRSMRTPTPSDGMVHVSVVAKCRTRRLGRGNDAWNGLIGLERQLAPHTIWTAEVGQTTIFTDHTAAASSSSLAMAPTRLPSETRMQLVDRAVDC